MPDRASNPVIPLNKPEILDEIEGLAYLGCSTAQAAP